MEKAPRVVDLIVIHCSATRVDRDVTAKDIDAAHRVRGFACWGYHYYIRKSGKVETMRPEWQPGAHAYGYNARSIAVCYEGGLDENGKPADTRTLKQKLAMHELVYNLLLRYPKAQVAGHRDLSPDKNHNGRIEPWERIKECPCFDAIGELEHFRPEAKAVNM
jgi:N-acetylmuramoyl-L-alanine amidase